MKNNKLINGFTLIEVIVTLAVLGIAVGPLMSMFILSAQINQKSSTELKSLLAAQKYIEEIKAEEILDTEEYIYNNFNDSYEKKVEQTEGEYGAVIRITQENFFTYDIEIFITDEEKIINSIKGSKIKINKVIK
jgi:prepilin-type N-terminal cleavage/methylation domain-containing protein